MSGCAVVVLGVINHKSLIGGGINHGGIVPLTVPTLSLHFAPTGEGAHEFGASGVIRSSVGSIVVENIVRKERGTTGCILVRSQRIGAAENAHLVAFAGTESAVTHEKVVVTADVLDIRALAANVVAAGNLAAEVGIFHAVSSLGAIVGRVVGVVVLIIVEAGFLVQLEHEDATRPGAVGYPQFTGFIKKDARVNAVGPITAPIVANSVAAGNGCRADSDGEVGFAE